MTRGRRWLVVLVSVGAAAVIAVSIVLLDVPLTGVPPGDAVIGGRLYSFEAVSLFRNVPDWQNYSYRGVTFEFHLWCEITPAAGEVCGNATEAAGTRFPYSFGDGPPQVNPSWQTWPAPDGHEAVQYREGGMARLLVAI